MLIFAVIFSFFFASTGTAAAKTLSCRPAWTLHAPAVVRTSATTPPRTRNCVDTQPGFGKHRRAQKGRRLEARGEGGGDGSREHSSATVGVRWAYYFPSLSLVHAEKHTASFDCKHWLTPSLLLRAPDTEEATATAVVRPIPKQEPTRPLAVCCHDSQAV